MFGADGILLVIFYNIRNILWGVYNYSTWGMVEYVSMSVSFYAGREDYLF